MLLVSQTTSEKT